MIILITGSAGFIGFHVCMLLLQNGHSVVGIDNLNDYYDPQLKKNRHVELENFAMQNAGRCSYRFYKGNIDDNELLGQIFQDNKFDVIINLAAQAGVRYSIENPMSYVKSNIVGFTLLMEQAKRHRPAHFIYASTSSVYGANKKLPFSENDPVDHPLQFYAATKRANELIAHSYSNLFDIPTTGLRFFTAYGPWGRPDMALFKFTKGISEGLPIDVYNYGKHVRDFTYVTDIAFAISRLLDEPPKSDDCLGIGPDSSEAPFRILNIGNSSAVSLMDYIKQIESELSMKAKINFMELQLGDVVETVADTSKLTNLIGNMPKTDYQVGVARFVDWYKKYYMGR